MIEVEVKITTVVEITVMVAVVMNGHGMWNIVENGVKELEDDGEHTLDELNALKKKKE